MAYPTMGNHECTGYTTSNCGIDTKDGFTANYNAFLAKMLAPLGVSTPYYAEYFSAADGSWTAKFIFIAGNSWGTAQSTWLDKVLAQPTTYTFAVRHEPHYSNTAPGVDPSTTILAEHPLTMLITGHTHSYAHVPAYREIIVGNGGAPLTSSQNYGYVMVERQPDSNLRVTSYDYQTHAIVEQFTVMPSGLAPPP
jgi:predicted phosphodiesterase